MDFGTVIIWMRGNTVHFEFLVEDISGKKALDILIPKILTNEHTFKVHPYKGIGRIPKNLRSKNDANTRILLDQLPRILRGYGKTFENYPRGYKAAVILVCDLDDKCLATVRKELFDVLEACTPRPETRFCIAIEEGEAWLLGDIAAIKAAYPKAKDAVLRSYKNDSICGTWERLADAVYKDGATALKAEGWQAVGAEKSRWAEYICPEMSITANQSPSFLFFCKTVVELANSG